MHCPACGEGVSEAARFCPECGHALAARPDERRLVTVLMADIVLFSIFEFASGFAPSLTSLLVLRFLFGVGMGGVAAIQGMTFVAVVAGTRIVPQPEVNYMTVGPSSVYMFPRQDGILLGGTHERGDFRLEPDPSTVDRVLRENGALFANMRAVT